MLTASEAGLHHDPPEDDRDDDQSFEHLLPERLHAVQVEQVVDQDQDEHPAEGTLRRTPAAGRAAVAPSALAHVTDPAAATEADAEATGMLPDGMDGSEGTDPPRAAAPAAGSDDGTSRPWRRILVFLSGAVLAGAALGDFAVP